MMMMLMLPRASAGEFYPSEGQVFSFFLSRSRTCDDFLRSQRQLGTSKQQKRDTLAKVLALIIRHSGELLEESPATPDNDARTNILLLLLHVRSFVRSLRLARAPLIALMSGSSGWFFYRREQHCGFSFSLALKLLPVYVWFAYTLLIWNELANERTSERARLNYLHCCAGKARVESSRVSNIREHDGKLVSACSFSCLARLVRLLISFFFFLSLSLPLRLLPTCNSHNNYD